VAFFNGLLGLYRQMLALEPNSPKAMICVASALTDLAAASYKVGLDQNSIDRDFEEGRELALKARALGAKHPWIYEVPAEYAKFHDDQPGWLENSNAWQQASPNDLVPLIYVANASLYGGDLQNALALVQQAIAMDRSPPEWGELLLLGKTYFLLKDDAEAIAALQRARVVSPSSGTVYAYLAMANFSKGDEAAARTAVAELRNQQPQFTLKTFAHLEMLMPTSTPVYKSWWDTRVLPAWRHAGLPE
jgi:tetratricopeptide (TPR) repeat protein